jgi:hypothetical protein
MSTQITLMPVPASERITEISSLVASASKTNTPVLVTFIRMLFSPLARDTG